MKDRDMVWLQQLADGKAKKELVDATSSSARNRLRRMRKLLGCRTTEQLIAMAVANGWAVVR